MGWAIVTNGGCQNQSAIIGGAMASVVTIPHAAGVLAVNA